MCTANNKSNKIDDFINQSVNSIDQAQGFDPQQALLSRKSEKEKIRLELTEGMNNFIHHIANGYKLLKESLNAISIEDPEHLNLVNEANEFFNKNFDKLESQLTSEDVNGKLPYEVYGISDKTIHTFYMIANYYYSQSKFQEAAEILFFICLLSPLETHLWQALGHANYFCENYQEALYAYYTAFVLGDDPRCLFYAARCFEKQKDFEKAISCMETALEIIENDENFINELQEDAKKYKSFLNEQLLKEGQKNL